MCLEWRATLVRGFPEDLPIPALCAALWFHSCFLACWMAAVCASVPRWLWWGTRHTDTNACTYQPTFCGKLILLSIVLLLGSGCVNRALNRGDWKAVVTVDVENNVLLLCKDEEFCGMFAAREWRTCTSILLRLKAVCFRSRHNWWLGGIYQQCVGFELPAVVFGFRGGWKSHLLLLFFAQSKRRIRVFCGTGETVRICAKIIFAGFQNPV